MKAIQRLASYYEHSLLYSWQIRYIIEFIGVINFGISFLSRMASRRPAQVTGLAGCRS